MALRALYTQMNKINLRPVKRMDFRFDPFHENSESIRNFLHHVSSKRRKRTNELCLIKTQIVNDRSEPTLQVALDNGLNITFKAANLSATDIAEEFNNIVNRFCEPEEIPTTKFKTIQVRREEKEKKAEREKRKSLPVDINLNFN